MTLKRVLASVFAAVVVLGLGTIALVGWALSTESGTAWVLGQVEARAAPRLTIGAVQGTLRGTLILDDVVVLLDAGEVYLSRIELRLDLSALLDAIIVLDELAIAEVDYRSAPTASGGAGKGAMADSLKVLVRRGSVQRLRVASADQEIELGPIGFSLAVDGPRVAVTDVDAKLQGVEVQGDAELQLETELGVSAQFDWTTAIDSVGVAAGRGRVDGILPTLQVQQELSLPFVAMANGTIDLGQSPHADLEIQWSELALPSLTLAESPAGEMRVTGWLDDYSFEGSGEIEIEALAARFSAAGSGTTAALSFDRLELSNPDGDVAAVGQITIEPVTWVADVEASNLDPSLLFVDWPGSLAIDGRLQGSLEPALEWTLIDASVSGVLRDQFVEATGGLAFRSPGIWRVDAVNLRSGVNYATVDGTVGREFDLDLIVDAPELAALWPDATGALALDGGIGGTPDVPELRGRLEGRALTIGEYAAESVVVSGEVSLRENAPLALEIVAQAVRWRNTVASSVSGRVSGSSSQHAIELDVQSTYGSGRLRAAGELSRQVWSGRVNTIGIDQPSLGAWELAESTALVIGRDSLRLDPMCIRQGQTALCGFARIGFGSDNAEFTLTDFDLSALNVFLSEGVSLEGMYDASITMAGPIARPTGSLSATGTSTLLTVQEGDAPRLVVPIETLGLEARLTERAFEINGGLQGIGGAQVTFDADITNVWADDPAIRGNFSGVWTDLGLISLLSPEIGAVSGSATLDVGIGGSLQSPQLTGEARWLEGQIGVPRWGFLIEGIDVRATSVDGSRVVLEASGMAGEGRIDVDGTMALDPDAGWVTRLSIRGESLQAVRLPDAEIFVSPDLQVQAALPNVEVSGSVLIPRARLLLDEIPAQAVVPSTDTVIHGTEVSTVRRPLNVLADLRVILGDDIRYAGGGLDVGLTGEMGLDYESGRGAIASGEINLEGQYRTYGQALDLEGGKLIFNGPIDNPVLDVRAIRRIESTTAGVQLGGTLEAPTTRIFSEPAMSEADALAYLLFGRPLSGSGDQETATLQSAAVSMGLQQALPVVQRFGQTLGLDELTVQATDADAGELMAGKQISPRVYMRYSYGLFNRLGGLLMRFRLNERLSLETRSGDYKAMDLMLTVEKD